MAVQRKPPQQRQRVIQPPEARAPQRRKQVRPGQRYGELTVGKFLWSHPERGHAWLLRCDCGRLAIRHTGQLFQAERRGDCPACLTCVAELRRGRRIETHARNHQYFLLLWEASGSLYSRAWEARLRAALRGELELPDPDWSLAEPPANEPPPQGPDRWAGAVRVQPERMDRPALTLDDVGALLGLTRERIRQIQSEALRKLRHPSRAVALMAFAGSEYREISYLRSRALGFAIQRIERAKDEERKAWDRRSNWMRSLSYTVGELARSNLIGKLPITIDWYEAGELVGRRHRYGRMLGVFEEAVQVQIGQRVAFMYEHGDRKFVSRPIRYSGPVEVTAYVVLQL